jgi:hypothetical protein
LLIPATKTISLFIGVPPPDLRESVFLGPVDHHRGYYAGLPEAATSYAPNLVPTEPPGLAATLAALYREYERLAADMLRPGETPRDQPITAGEHIRRKIERSHETG